MAEALIFGVWEALATASANEGIAQFLQRALQLGDVVLVLADAGDDGPPVLAGGGVVAEDHRGQRDLIEGIGLQRGDNLQNLITAKQAAIPVGRGVGLRLTLAQALGERLER